MKIFLFILAFITVFLIFMYFGETWFPGLGDIKALWALAIAAIVCITSFGVIDLVLPDEKK